ncbi:MAG: sigma-70 family RNA polymerase sigma factor [Bacteroidales bacterium]|nr:sigma-70 family RNA polymerase sigma factor [Bacteroidales bacterium]
MDNDNQQDLSEWVESFTGELFARAYYKVSDPELAKDLVQETFLAASENYSTFKGKSSPKTWLFSILNNKIVDHYRKKVKQPVNTDDQILADFFDENKEWKHAHRPKDWKENQKNLLDDDEFLEVLNKCLDELPSNWNTCVKLKYLTQKKGKEICQELNISQSNYWQIIHRSKIQLRDCIEKNWFKN